MGVLGWLALIIWGLNYLPGLTGFLLVLAIAFFTIVLILDQFGLVPKSVRRSGSSGVGRIWRIDRD
jgi:hypothetical protein